MEVVLGKLIFPKKMEIATERLGDVRGRNDFIQQYNREKAQLYRELYQRAESQGQFIAAHDVSTQKVHIRNYNVKFTRTPPIIDGIVSQGEGLIRNEKLTALLGFPDGYPVLVEALSLRR